ncbi:MAG: glycosyltransferase [bacterium]
MKQPIIDNRTTKPAVAHVVKDYLGISETFIYNVIAHIRNYDCAVFTDRTQNLEQFPVSRIYCASSARKYSWQWLVNYLDYLLSDRAAYFEQRVYFRKLMKQNHVKLIHAHFAPQGVQMLFCRQALNIPLVTSFYGYDMSRLPRDQQWCDRLKQLFQYGDLFLVEGPHMQKGLEGLGCAAHKIRLQPIGLDLKQYKFNPRTAPKTDSPTRILFCGRFVEKKGLQYGLQAVQAVIDEFPDVEFRVIGDGEQKSNLDRFVRKNGLKERVTFLGYQPHAEVLAEMQQAHLLLQPSVTAADGDSEGGAPTVLLEAQALGLPVLSTRHADIPNVVQDGKSGILVPERDARALANALKSLLGNPNSWTAMGHAGREYVERFHNLEPLTQKLESYYSQLLHAET